MKTAISLPDPLFAEAEDLAQQLGVSRSQLYALALAEFVSRRKDDDVTARLNAVFRDQSNQLEPNLAEMQWASLPKDEW